MAFINLFITVSILTRADKIKPSSLEQNDRDEIAKATSIWCKPQTNLLN